MKAQLCWFRLCDWMHIGNMKAPGRAGRAGLYQCTRCKTISLGAPR